MNDSMEHISDGNCPYCGTGETQLTTKIGLQQGSWHIDCVLKLSNELALRNMSLLEQMKKNNEAMQTVNDGAAMISESNTELTLNTADEIVTKLNQEGAK
ncbi:MAG: hypothetical protein Q8L37_07235 [Candidatus Gottesmanbacteria bacterium]|nr:hypothetical protein [Candidatus Gottesmanbacteria bacterium]